MPAFSRLWLRTDWVPQREGACVKSKPGARRPGSPRQSLPRSSCCASSAALGIGLAELKTAMEKAPSLRFLPLDLAQVNEFAAHSGVRDPFDRLIISACRTVGAKLMTRDRFLHDSGLVQVVWK
jgi:hypothetical protein